MDWCCGPQGGRFTNARAETANFVGGLGNLGFLKLVVFMRALIVVAVVLYELAAYRTSPMNAMQIDLHVTCLQDARNILYPQGFLNEFV